MTERAKPIVLMDLDNTILNFDIAEAAAIGKTLECHGIDPTPELIRRYNLINISQWEKLERGEISRHEVLVGRFRMLFDELGEECDCEEVQEMYEGLLAQGHWFMPGAEELLTALKDDYRLFICSNGTARVQAGRLESSGIEPYFEKIFVSELMKVNKPSPEYFRACFDEISDFDKDRTIMIGDSLTSDILGGRNAGIMTCWYNPKGKVNGFDFSPDYEVRQLGEIPALLRKLFP